jgi:hypothetical protein
LSQLCCRSFHNNPGSSCYVQVSANHIPSIWAWVVNLEDPEKFFLDQVPASTITKTFFSPNALAMTLQIGNVYALLAALAIICCFTTHSEIPRRYLLVVAFADLGHIYSYFPALGSKVFWDVTQWNGMVWGGVGVSLFLHLNRLCTLAGLYGKMGNAVDRLKAR